MTVEYTHHLPTTSVGRCLSLWHKRARASLVRDERVKGSRIAAVGCLAHLSRACVGQLISLLFSALHARRSWPLPRMTTRPLGCSRCLRMQMLLWLLLPLLVMFRRKATLSSPPPTVSQSARSRPWHWWLVQASMYESYAHDQECVARALDAKGRGSGSGSRRPTCSRVDGQAMLAQY